MSLCLLNSKLLSVVFSMYQISESLSSNTALLFQPASPISAEEMIQLNTTLPKRRFIVVLRIASWNNELLCGWRDEDFSNFLGINLASLKKGNKEVEKVLGAHPEDLRSQSFDKSVDLEQVCCVKFYEYASSLKINSVEEKLFRRWRERSEAFTSNPRSVSYRDFSISAYRKAMNHKRETLICAIRKKWINSFCIDLLLPSELQIVGVNKFLPVG